jgi:hypothetical protein
LTVISAIFVSAARGGTIYTTFGPGNSFDANNSVSFSSTGSPNGYAVEFASSTTLQVQSVSLALDAAAAGATVSITIRSNSASGPFITVLPFTSAAIPTQPGIVTFNSLDPFSLSAGVSYWISAIVSSGQINWFENDQGISDNIASHTGGNDNFGWTVNGPGTAMAFEVESVPEPGLAALGLLGAAACWVRRHEKAKH